MSADLISADFKSKTWVSDRQRQEADKQALEVMTAALMGEPGMCGMEPVVYLEMMDTACSEMNPDQSA